MKHLMILLSILFIGCGGGENPKNYPDLVYDNDNTKQKIYTIQNIRGLFNFIKPIGYLQDRTRIILTREQFDSILEDNNQTATDVLNNITIDFTYNSIVLVYHSLSCIQETAQVFISMENEDNAIIKIQAKPMNGICSDMIKPVTRTFVVSKDILRVNGEDNF